ncbi:MAG: hypothetical protein AB199_04045 [Parcubacteria bacterium C7867-004]|nr:MAG: hypothetical protein AB199_04045 [Parcubacteria bacterium C7867-004]
MSNLFQYVGGNPFHISVGAVLVNNESKICVHKMSKETLAPEVQAMIGNLDEIYILMRESLEEGETLDQAVLRGIKEEFGAEGIVTKYLGCIEGPAFNRGGNKRFEKATLYFEVKLTNLGDRPADDPESNSTMLWLDPEDIIEKMSLQKNISVRTDLNESKILEAYVKYR